MAPSDPGNPQTPSQSKLLQLHPLSGAALLLLDNLLFGANLATAGFSTPLAMTLAFSATLLSVWIIQRKWGGDSRRKSFIKALAAGFVAGLPFSVAGTAVGAWILVRAGMTPQRRRPL